MPPININANDDTRRAANLRALQRLDQSVLEIVGSATHVVLYEFNETAQAWEKRNVEGSLFVAKRSDFPRFKMIVMNRNSRENLEVSIASTFQMQVRDPYLIFRDKKGGNNDSSDMIKIRGLWFHDGKEREEIARILERVVKSLSHTSELEDKQNMPTVESIEQGHQAQKTEKSEAAALLLSKLQLNDSKKNANEKTDVGASSSTAKSNQILSKKDLQVALMSLLEDERFIDLIHAQYLKTVKNKARET